MSLNQTLKKPAKSALTDSGTGFGNREAVQFKITHKDLVLVAGILVAIIITLTIWMMDNQTQGESSTFTKPKVTPAVLHKIGKTVLQKF